MRYIERKKFKLKKFCWTRKKKVGRKKGIENIKEKTEDFVLFFWFIVTRRGNGYKHVGRLL